MTMSPLGPGKQAARQTQFSAMTIYCICSHLVYTQSIPQIPARHCNCVYYHDRQPYKAIKARKRLRRRRPPRQASRSLYCPLCSCRRSSDPRPSIWHALFQSAQCPRLQLRYPRRVQRRELVLRPLSHHHRLCRHRESPVVQPLPSDEEAKLVYGVILLVRIMVKHLSGRYVSTPCPPLLLLCFEVIVPILVPHSPCSGRDICQLPHVDMQAHVDQTNRIYSKRSGATALSC